MILILLIINMFFVKNLVALLNRLPLVVNQIVAYNEQRQICFQSNHRFSSQTILRKASHGNM